MNSKVVVNNNKTKITIYVLLKIFYSYRLYHIMIQVETFDDILNLCCKMVCNEFCFNTFILQNFVTKNIRLKLIYECIPFKNIRFGPVFVCNSYDAVISVFNGKDTALHQLIHAIGLLNRTEFKKSHTVVYYNCFNTMAVHIS